MVHGTSQRSGFVLAPVSSVNSLLLNRVSWHYNSGPWALT